MRGCDTEECINNRIRRKKSKKLNILVEHGYAFRLLLESWLHPHPDYKEILGMDDVVYEEWVRERKKQESDEELKEIKEYERYMRSERLKKKKRAE